MRTWTTALILGGLTLLSWSLVLFEIAKFEAVSIISLGLAVAFTTMLLMVPFFTSRGTPAMQASCRECHAQLGAGISTGFCLHCGCFTSAAAQRYWAHHV